MLSSRHLMFDANRTRLGFLSCIFKCLQALRINNNNNKKKLELMNMHIYVATV